LAAKDVLPMFHSNTEQLISYWRTRRSAGAAPVRANINPADFSTLAPQVFMLGRRGPGRFHFRLVGGFIADLHGEDLRESDLLALFDAGHRTALQLALEALCREPQPLVIDCEARPREGQPLRLEIMIAPLIGPSGGVDRFIGLYQPTSPVAVLMGRPVHSLAIRAISAADSTATSLPRLRLAAVEGRRIA
jgi:hypothetical protein